MDTSQTLSIESFSYSWLVNIKPSFDSLGESFRASIDAYDEASFIEMDPKLPASKRFFIGSQEFNFDFPKSESPRTLVHADELISDGFLIPLFMKSLETMEGYDDVYTSDSTPTTPISGHDQKKGKIRRSSIRMCRMLSKRILEKYLEFIRPLCQKLRGRRFGSRIEAAGSRMQVVYSPSTSPRASLGDSVGYWRMPCDSESSIREAVLHCKRSIGMFMSLVLLLFAIMINCRNCGKFIKFLTVCRTLSFFR